MERMIKLFEKLLRKFALQKFVCHDKYTGYYTSNLTSFDSLEELRSQIRGMLAIDHYPEGMDDAVMIVHITSHGYQAIRVPIKVAFNENYEEIYFRKDKSNV